MSSWSAGHLIEQRTATDSLCRVDLRSPGGGARLGCQNPRWLPCNRWTPPQFGRHLRGTQDVKIDSHCQAPGRALASRRKRHEPDRVRRHLLIQRVDPRRSSPYHSYEQEEYASNGRLHRVVLRHGALLRTFSAFVHGVYKQSRVLALAQGTLRRQALSYSQTGGVRKYFPSVVWSSVLRLPSLWCWGVCSGAGVCVPDEVQVADIVISLFALV